jgi:hypothetical protein
LYLIAAASVEAAGQRVMFDLEFLLFTCVYINEEEKSNLKKTFGGKMEEIEGGTCIIVQFLGENKTENGTKKEEDFFHSKKEKVFCHGLSWLKFWVLGFLCAPPA